MQFRILSLDGGGAWALLQAMALREIYGDENGRAILADFDLVAANSGGGIVLGALIKDYRPSQIIELFNDERRRRTLFVKKPLLARLPSLLGLGPRYSTPAKHGGIAATLGAALAGTPLKDLGALLPRPGGTPVKLVVLGFDYDRQRASFFRSFATRAGSPASPVPLCDAINASSTAPVNYFDRPAPCDGRRYWDGAVGGYNNPLMAAVVEAMVDGATPRDIVALSLGTGSVRLVQPPTEAAAREGFLVPRARSWLIGDIRKVATAILDDPPDAASYVAYVTLGNAPLPPGGGSGSIVRLNPSIQPVLDEAANCWKAPPGLTDAEFDVLSTLDVGEIGQDAIDRIVALGKAWIAGGVPNQPIRMGSDRLDCELGDPTFAAGAQRWRALRAG